MRSVWFLCVAVTCMAPVAHAQKGMVEITPRGVVVETLNEKVSVGPGGVTIRNGSPAGGSHTGGGVAPAASAGALRFVNGDYSNLDLSAQDLRGSSFVNVDFINIDFRGADLRGSSFSNVDMTDCDLRGALLSGASFTNTDFGNSRVGGVDFSQVKLVNTDMDSVDFRVDSAVPATNITAALTDRSAQATPSMNLAVYFDFDKDTLTAQGWQQVTELAKALAEPALADAPIRIEGHTDAKGTDAYNVDLSYRRAARVMRVLSEQLGIAAERLSIQGFGESKPVADNDSEFGRSQNRRVTVVNLSQS